jgi:hypothetical protein
MKTWNLAVLVFCALPFDNSFSQEAAGSRIVRNTINVGPLSAAFGNVDGYYEHLFGKKHGLMIEATYMALETAKGYSMRLDYRYHFFWKPNHRGLNSPFWGPFIYGEKSKNVLVIGGASYDLNYQAVKAGIQLGRRWIFWRFVNGCLEIGYGFPVYTKYTWSPSRPSGADLVELLATIGYGLMGEASLGFAF